MRIISAMAMQLFDSRSSVLLCILFIASSSAQDATSTWSECNKSCGGGRRTRKICYWGTVCSTIFQGCNTQPCESTDPDPVLNTWTQCSRTCGGGTRFKVNKCSESNAANCSRTYQECNMNICQTLNTCPAGYTFRYQDPSSCCKISKEKCGLGSSSAQRVVGGYNAPRGHWPWTAAIVNRTTHIIHCGAALIHDRWIITAAHCFSVLPKSALYVLLGSVKIKKPDNGHAKFEIEDFFVHDNYSAYPKNDIALVKLDKKAVFTDKIKPICLPNGEITELDTSCMILGWGITKWYDVSTVSDRLKQVALKVLPFDACIQGYKLIRDSIWKSLDEEQHFCVGRLAGGRSSCKGDSGSPMVCQRCSSCGWYLAATISGGAIACGSGQLPSYYMRVHRYESWIRKHVPLSNVTVDFTCRPSRRLGRVF